LAELSSFSFSSFRSERVDALMSHWRLPTIEVLSMFYARFEIPVVHSTRSTQADPASAPDGETNQKPEAELPSFFF
jgi:hypothetical protein